MSGLTPAERFVSPHLFDATYSGVETLESIAKEIGLPLDKIVKLNANENIYGAPKEVLDAITKVDHHVYPDPAQAKLRVALAGLMGVTPENICCGAGSDDILDIIIRMSRPEAIVTSTPTFGMYKFLGQLNDVKVVNVPRRADFTVDIDQVIEAVNTNNAKVLFLASPNNPTGTILPNEEIKRLCEELTSCLIVVDEAYAEFCDSSALELFGQYDNLVICRTLSKWAGLAGLRLGYGIAHPDLQRVMMAIKQPYNVSTAAEAAGLAAIEHRDKILVTCQAMRVERDRIIEGLAEFSWLSPVPSDSNFVLVKVDQVPAKDVYDTLRRRGIIIRFFGSQGGDLHSYIRISAGKPEHTDAVLDAIREIAKEKQL